MRLASIILPLSLLLAAGCRPLTEPGGVDVRFSSSLAGPGQDSLGEVVSASGGSGAIVVVGTMRTASSCYVLSPSVQRNGERIVATVSARESIPGCGAESTLYEYTLRIGGLAPGAYHLTVAHAVSTPSTADASVWTPLDATLWVQ